MSGCARLLRLHRFHLENDRYMSRCIKMRRYIIITPYIQSTYEDIHIYVATLVGRVGPRDHNIINMHKAGKSRFSVA